MGADNTRQAELAEEQRLQECICRRVMERLDLSEEMSDEGLLRFIQEEVCCLGRQKVLSMEQRMRLQKQVYNSLCKWDVLSELLEDDTITEIMINGPDHIYIERGGRLEETTLAFSSSEKLQDVIQRIVAWNNQVVNESNPIVDTRLPDGSRVNIVLSPVAVDSSAVSIRKFPKHPLTMKGLVKIGAVSEEIVLFLQKLVEAGYNIFVSGGTGSGKTTFLNALAEFIPGDQRVVTIEDSAELQLHHVRNLVRLEARDANLEGRLEVSIRQLVRTSLRMRPDRIIVGECRGAEALEMLQAFNTGHDGSFCTGHSNSAYDMLRRLETMVLMGTQMPLAAIRQQIASGVDIIVHLGRLRDKSRKVLEIAEVSGMEGQEIVLQTLYRFAEKEEKKGQIVGLWQREGELRHQQKLRRHGVWPL